MSLLRGNLKAVRTKAGVGAEVQGVSDRNFRYPQNPGKILGRYSKVCAQKNMNESTDLIQCLVEGNLVELLLLLT